MSTHIRPKVAAKWPRAAGGKRGHKIGQHSRRRERGTYMMSPNFKRDWTRAHVLWSLSVTALRRRYRGELLGTTSGTESRTCRCCAPPRPGGSAGDAQLPAAATDGANTLCRREDGVKGLPPPKPPPPPWCHSLEPPLSADLSAAAAAAAFGVLPRRRLLMCRPATPPNIPPHLKHTDNTNY